MRVFRAPESDKQSELQTQRSSVPPSPDGEDGRPHRLWPPDVALRPQPEPGVSPALFARGVTAVQTVKDDFRGRLILSV